MDEELKHEYEVLVIAHFIYRGYTFNRKNVERGIRDLNFFRPFYDTAEDCLNEIYPKERSNVKEE